MPGNDCHVVGETDDGDATEKCASERGSRRSGDGEEARDGRTAEGVEHLRAAARELIAATRSFLDVAEDAIEDVGVTEEIAELLHNLGRRASATRTDGPEGRSSPDGPRGEQSGTGARDGSGMGSDQPDQPARSNQPGQSARPSRPRVRRIDVESGD